MSSFLEGLRGREGSAVCLFVCVWSKSIPRGAWRKQEYDLIIVFMEHESSILYCCLWISCISSLLPCISVYHKSSSMIPTCTVLSEICQIVKLVFVARRSDEEINEPRSLNFSFWGKYFSNWICHHQKRSVVVGSRSLARSSWDLVTCE